jgi:hypothetical protein
VFEKTMAERLKNAKKAAEAQDMKRKHIQSFIDRFRWGIIMMMVTVVVVVVVVVVVMAASHLSLDLVCCGGCTRDRIQGPVLLNPVVPVAGAQPGVCAWRGKGVHSVQV